MSSDYAREERIAIRVHHGGLSESQAVRLETTGHEDRAAFKPVSDRWHAVAQERHGRDLVSKAHDALKAKHGADRWHDLTIGQLEDSIERMKGE